MNISIFGLGYVGCVTAACLAKSGHRVIGVDVNEEKVRQVAAGESPIIEPQLAEMLRDGVDAGRLGATTDVCAAVRESEISLICVGTPSNANGSLRLSYVSNVARQIGAALAKKEGYHTIVVRSTVLPGSVRECVIPYVEELSGKVAGRDFGVAMNPEFLREGSAVRDYEQPSVIVIGEIDERSGDATAQLYAELDAPVVRVGLESAEMIKYANNLWHGTKVTFANEIGNVCKAHGIDGRDVMEIVCQDTVLNVSAAYMRPGFAFGGSCLPKDSRALLYRARSLDLETPLLRSVLESNAEQVAHGVRLVEKAGQRRVGVLGLSFKAHTDDVRESPTVTLIERLIGRGFEVQVYDENVRPDHLIGSNRRFLDGSLPHIASLMCESMGEVVTSAETIIVANGSPAFRDVGRRLSADQTLIDLVGVDVPEEGAYEGICW